MKTATSSLLYLLLLKIVFTEAHYELRTGMKKLSLPNLVIEKNRDVPDVGLTANHNMNSQFENGGHVGSADMNIVHAMDENIEKNLDNTANDRHLLTGIGKLFRTKILKKLHILNGNIKTNINADDNDYQLQKYQPDCQRRITKLFLSKDTEKIISQSGVDIKNERESKLQRNEAILPPPMTEFHQLHENIDKNRGHSVIDMAAANEKVSKLQRDGPIPPPPMAESHQLHKNIDKNRGHLVIDIATANEKVSKLQRDGPIPPPPMTKSHQLHENIDKNRGHSVIDMAAANEEVSKLQRDGPIPPPPMTEFHQFHENVDRNHDHSIIDMAAANKKVSKLQGGPIPPPPMTEFHYDGLLNENNENNENSKLVFNKRFRGLIDPNR